MSGLFPDITHWTRLEPRPRVNDFVSSLRAEVRDPMWLLTRQRRVREFQGEDTGSPAYVRYTRRWAPFTKWAYRVGVTLNQGVVEVPLEAGRPIEAQALSEPHTPDLAMRVELGQVFFDLLDTELTSDTVRKKIKDRFRSRTIAPWAQFTPVAAGPEKFNPRDRGTTQFLLVTEKRSVDGFKIYLKAKEVQAPGGTFPPDLADNAGERDAIKRTFDKLIKWVIRTYGALAEGVDPPNWDHRRLEYDLQVRAGQGSEASMSASPDRDGALPWPSFDLITEPGDPLSGGQSKTETQIPSHVRFKGMPAPRFWDFEEGDMALPEVKPDMLELAKLVLIDYAVVAGIDWFTIPIMLENGNIARIDNVKVRDVFGHDTVIPPAESAGTPEDPRWVLYSPAQAGGTLASFKVLPPSAGRAGQAGPVLEEVRFARDEGANFVWAIERITESEIGEPRSGNERDSTVATPAPPAAPPTTAPLRYQIESKVPVNWIPFLGVRPDQNQPAIELEKAAVLRPDPVDEGEVAIVPSTTKVLSPEKLKGPGGTVAVYRMPEEEVPRAGLKMQRLVMRSRWKDGSTHVWVTRRKLVGAGETQSGLRFDAALPTKT